MATSKLVAHMCRVYNERVGRKERKLPDLLRDVNGKDNEDPATDEATKNNPRILLCRSAIHSSFNQSTEEEYFLADTTRRCTYEAN